MKARITRFLSKVEPDFKSILYGQCWEDADVLVEALPITNRSVCLSIVSAGDNTLALLAHGPKKVIAIDVHPAQMACLELKIAAFKTLGYEEVLEFVGAKTCFKRRDYYDRCRPVLSDSAQAFWDTHIKQIEVGIGNTGKMEHYLSLVRTALLPLVHSRKTVIRLLEHDTLMERENFYSNVWNTWRWRLFFKVFFSRWLLHYLSPDPHVMDEVKGSVSNDLLDRVGLGLTVLNPRDNPYLQWIMFGFHPHALPYYLRAENFELICRNLDRLEIHTMSLEDFLDRQEDSKIDHFNLSDVFDALSEESYHRLLGKLVRVGRPGGRLLYWNLWLHRRRPEFLKDKLDALTDLSSTLHLQDKTFFYRDFVVEQFRD